MSWRNAWELSHRAPRERRHEERGSRNLRIAIIGAGVAGLSAAQRLKDLGYRDITIYEKEDRVGGKVLSYRHKGRVYELGALWSSGQYKVINALAARFWA